MMGRILDFLPELYRQEGNELVGFLEQLEPEIVDLEQKIEAITHLIDVDRCPEEYLPYLASLTNVQLVGDNPKLWRRQIRNWPWLLKLKGTEKSLALFLNSIGAESYKLYTWFRDENGEFVEHKPEEEPFYHSESGLWRNIRTHYFSVDMFIENALLEYEIWSPEEIKSKILPWFERAKPFHAELLRFTISFRRTDTIPVYYGHGTMFGGSISVNTPAPEDRSGEQRLYYGLGASLGGTMAIDTPSPDGAAVVPQFVGVGTVLTGIMQINAAKEVG